jgi:cobalt-zinc-cadmium efflux system membrane fusion protein
VREDLVGKIRTEAPPSIRLLSFAGETFTGRLLRVGSTVARETRTVEFLFEVPNPERKLRAGMFAYVSLATDRIDDGLFVPDEAVQTIGGRSVVFVEQVPGTYRVTEVRLGRRAGEMVEILGGIASGARVVTTGSFVLKSEAMRSEFAEEMD